MASDEPELKAVTLHFEPFRLLTGSILCGLLGAIGGVFWWITRLDESESWVSAKNVCAAVCLGFLYLSAYFAYRLKARVPAAILDKDGIELRSALPIFGWEKYLWTEIDSAPQVRRYRQVGHGPSSDMLYIHFFDGRWRSIVEDYVSIPLEDLQLLILKFLDRYGDFSAQLARPITDPPPNGTGSDPGRFTVIPTPEAYALRFAINTPPLPALRAMQMCFPKDDNERLAALLVAAKELYSRGGQLYYDVQDNKLTWQGALARLQSEFPQFAPETQLYVLNLHRSRDR